MCGRGFLGGASYEGPAYIEKYSVPQLASLKLGTYDLAMKLYCPEEKRPVLLALQQKLKDEDGFYTVGSVEIR